MNDSSSDSDEEMLNLLNPRQRNYRQRINMFHDYENDDISRFRLNNEQFEAVLTSVEADLQHATARNHALSPSQQLKIALRFFATGGNLSLIGDSHGVHKSTVSRIINRVTSDINNNLYEQHVQFPQLPQVVQQFKDVASIPCIIGCVDGTYVDIKRPHENENQYVNRHGNHSLNTMIVCGPDLRIYFCSARWPGSVSDSRVFRNSSLCDALTNGWRPVNGAILLGDSGYPNNDYLITPVPIVHTEQENRFNVAHKRTRRFVECTIGLLKERFRCLQTTLHFEPLTTAAIIKSCIVLHNIATEQNHILVDLQNDNAQSNQVDNNANNMNNRRNQLINLF